MAKKFGMKPSLTVTCEKCPGNNLIIFEDATAKYCEKCYLELDQKFKQEQANTLDQSQI